MAPKQRSGIAPTKASGLLPCIFEAEGIVGSWLGLSMRPMPEPVVRR